MVFEKLVEEQQKHPWIFLGGVLLIVALLLSVAVNLQLDPSLSAMIPDDGEYNTNDNINKVAFDSGNALIVLIKEDKQTILSNAVKVDSQEVQEYILLLQETVSQSQYVTEVSDIEFSEQTGRLFISVRTPEYVGGSTDVKKEIEFYMNQISPPPGITATLTGFPLLLDRVATLLIQDNLNTIILTIIFIFLFLMWYFKNIRFVLAVMISPLIALIALAASMVALDIAITIPLAAVGVLVLGLGVDYSIHIAIHYKDERKHLKHKEALLKVIEDLKIPISASFLTTLAGFSALIMGVSPSTQNQGIVLALAISFIYAISFTIFPLFVTLLAKDVELKENKTFTKIKKYLAHLAVIQAKHPWRVIIGFGIITVIMFFGMTQVQFSTSNSNWIPDNDAISTSFRENAYAFGDQEAIIIILQATEGDLRDVQTARDVNRIEQLIRDIPQVDSVQSAFTSISYDKNELYDELTNTPQRRDQFNEDYTITRIIIRTQNLDENDAGNSRIVVSLREILAQQPIHNTKTSLYGDTIRFEELSESLQADAAVTTMAGIILVLVIASIIYMSVKVGLIALIPIIIGLVWAIGLMGFLNVPFTSLSTGIVSLVLGIGIDFSIHLVDGIKRFLRTNPLEQALSKTLISSGTSILLSSATTFIGFMSLSFSQLLGTQRLGWSLSIAVVAVFIVSIMSVPAIMKLTQKQTKVKQSV